MNPLTYSKGGFDTSARHGRVVRLDGGVGTIGSARRYAKCFVCSVLTWRSTESVVKASRRRASKVDGRQKNVCGRNPHSRLATQRESTIAYLLSSSSARQVRYSNSQPGDTEGLRTHRQQRHFILDRMISSLNSKTPMSEIKASVSAHEDRFGVRLVTLTLLPFRLHTHGTSEQGSWCSQHMVAQQPWELL